MAGQLLPDGEEGLVHYGVGPFVEIGRPGYVSKVLRPNKTFSDRLEVTIAGVPIVLVHAPGETDDQLFVWLPEQRVVMPGDNLYKSFPNLYTLRGTHYRDVAAWYRSIDKMRALRPAHLAPSHTRPVSGEAEVMDILTAYRDGIQFVHDQTIRGMNQGLTPDELVETVVLPPHLKEHPYLIEYYGKVEWCVRGVFEGYLGWWDGNAATLMPAPPDERSESMARLAGGREELYEAARQAVEEGELRWAIELTDHLMRLDSDREISYELIRGFPVRAFIEALTVNLNPEHSLEADAVMAFHFSDTGEAYSIHVRRGVAEFQEGEHPSPDHVVTTTSETWLDIMAGRRSLPIAMAAGDVALEGGRLAIPSTLGFLAMFR